MTLGGTAAWWIAVALGARLPIFAALVPLVAMTGDPFSAVSVSVSRILGVFAGVLVGIAAVHLPLGLTPRVAAALLAGTLLAGIVRVGDRPNLEIPIAALFLIGFPGGHTWELGVQRIWETAIGAAVAVLIAALLWPPDPLRELERQLTGLRRAIVDDLTAIADDLATGAGTTAGRLEDVRAHSRDAVREVFDLEPAKQALRASPLRRGDADAVERLEARIHLAARVARHVRSLARDVADDPVHDERLAGATRDLADAADRALRGDDPTAPLERAADALAGPEPLAAQLRQLHVDLAATMRQDA
jgi:uncharacterized membrane protein YccC